MNNIQIKAYLGNGKYTNATIDNTKPDICSGKDAEGEFGCHKTFFMAKYPIYDKIGILITVINNPVVYGIPPPPQNPGLFPEPIPEELTKEQWFSHWIDCKFEKRFHKLYKDKKDKR